MIFSKVFTFGCVHLEDPVESPRGDARSSAHLTLNLRLWLLHHGCLILQAELKLWDGGEKVLSGTFSHIGPNGLPQEFLLVLEE